MMPYKHVLVWVFLWNCMWSVTAVTNNRTTLAGSIDVKSHDLYVEVDRNSSFSLIYTGTFQDENFTVNIYINDVGIVSPIPSFKFVNKSEEKLTVHGIQAGHVVITANSSKPDIDTTEAFIRVTVVHYKSLEIVSAVTGWIYFLAWSVSFYPQIYENWKRKSVVGLNFDLVALSQTGFFLYNLFNICLFWIPEVQREYFLTKPQAVNPVQLNDVVFTMHATFATFFTVVQCLIYDRGNQKVSKLICLVLGAIAVSVMVCLILAAASVFQWLTFLTVCSNIKLGITFIKYTPQAFMNFRRKSTQGWSIGGIWLDFTGGTFSMIQMFIISYNNNDWTSIFGDFTKFGLGLVSLIFDFTFFLQHYFLYKDSIPYQQEIASDLGISKD